MKLIATLVPLLFLGCTAGENLPESLEAAMLPVSGWTEEQKKLAAKIVVHRTYQVRTLLESAAKNGDGQLAAVAFNATLNDLSVFYQAGLYADIGMQYRHCILMLQNQVDAAKQVISGGALSLDKVDASKNACRSDIG